MDILNGYVMTADGIVEGCVCIEGGRIVAVEEGRCKGSSIAEGLILPPMVNSHTHCADHGLKIKEGLGLEELVAPPNGIKHRYLEEIDDPSLKNNMKNYSSISYNNGIGTFIDFREGGEKGCRLLREAVPEAVILGRPIGKCYDPDEIDGILSIADGIGISSISDMDHRYIEMVADHTRRKNKIFAVHASERIREDIDLILSLDPAFLVHMVEATDSDLLKCAEQEIPIVVCPRSNMYFGKIPPIKRMMDCGIDLAIGTDNAMLCSPDMRSEALAFGDILVKQGGSIEDVSGPMMTEGRKILYPHNKIHLSKGTAADLIVLPCPKGPSMENVLQNRDQIFRYDRREGMKK